MSYKITEEGNIATVHLDGEIDMDVTEKAKELIMPLIESHQKAAELGNRVVLKEISKSVLKVIMMAKLEQILIIE